MKKRKPPILLASIMVILIGAVAIINRPQAPAGEDGHNHEGEGNVLAQGRDARETKDSLATMAASAVGGNKPKNGPRGPEGDEVGADPIVVGKKPEKWDPKPTESSMSGQFYREEAANR